MPTYDYKCLDCTHKFQIFQLMTDKKLKICPKCKRKIKRLIGCGAGIIFKGSGFYETDYKRKGFKKQEIKEKNENSNKSK